MNRLLMDRLYELDLSLCIRCNHISTFRYVDVLFRSVSRLGNGVFWYSLMLVLPLVYGQAGQLATAHMLVAAILGLLVYRYLKKMTSRPRPYAVHPRVRQKTPSLDQFSFPSGHTLHAVSFSVIACSHFPEMSWLLIPFTLLIALSRPVLGLHYPSDVLAGAAIGAVFATATLHIPVFG